MGDENEAIWSNIMKCIIKLFSEVDQENLPDILRDIGRALESEEDDNLSKILSRVKFSEQKQAYIVDSLLNFFMTSTEEDPNHHKDARLLRLIAQVYPRAMLKHIKVILEVLKSSKRSHSIIEVCKILKHILDSYYSTLNLSTVDKLSDHLYDLVYNHSLSIVPSSLDCLVTIARQGNKLDKLV